MQELSKLIDELSKYSSATVHEALGMIGALSYKIKPITKGMKVCGPAVTVLCPQGDNLTLHKAMVMAKPGDVIIVNMGGYGQQGAWGEIMSLQCKVRGINGFVTDGGVRDVDEITEMRFPVFSGSICIQGTVKSVVGSINEQIQMGGVTVNPGDIVLGDDNGVVIVPKHRLSEAVAASAQREEKERVMKEKIKNGATTVELLGLEAKLGKCAGA